MLSDSLIAPNLRLPTQFLTACPGLFTARQSTAALAYSLLAQACNAVLEGGQSVKRRHKIHSKREINPQWMIPVPGKYSNITNIMFLRFQNSLGKVCALVAATLMLPVLTYAQVTTSAQVTTTSRPTTVPPRAPEVNTAWVLVPFLGGVLLYSWRRLRRVKA